MRRGCSVVICGILRGVSPRRILLWVLPFEALAVVFYVDMDGISY